MRGRVSQHLHQISASGFSHPRSAPLVLQAVKSGFFVMENRRFFEKNDWQTIRVFIWQF
jgi:hypothetical protein